MFKVKTKPNSNKELLEKISEREYIAQLKEPAENNRANKKLINLISKELKISARNIKIKNLKSRNKIIEILD